MCASMLKYTFAVILASSLVLRRLFDFSLDVNIRKRSYARIIRRGVDTVGNPHRAQISQFEFFEYSFYKIWLKQDKQFSIERFEPTVSQSTVLVPSPTSHISRSPESPAGALAVNGGSR